MTGREMRTELAAALGNRTDITLARLLQWMNWAILDVVGVHRKKLFTPTRFHALEKKTVFTAYIVEADIVSGSAGTYVINITSSDTYADYTDMAFYVASYTGTEPDGLIGQEAVITGWTLGTNTIVLNVAPDVELDNSTSIEIRPRYVNIEEVTGLNPLSEIWAIERLEYVDAGDPIVQVGWEDLVGVDVLTYASPSAFARRGLLLIFNSSLDSSETIRMWYYGYPTPFTETEIEDEVVLPIDWHEVVLAGAVFRGFSRLMEPDRAENAKNEYVDMAVNKQDGFQIEDDSKRQGGFRLKR